MAMSHGRVLSNFNGYRDRRDGEPAAWRRRRHPRGDAGSSSATAMSPTCSAARPATASSPEAVRGSAALGAGALHLRPDRQLSARQGERHLVQVDPPTTRPTLSTGAVLGDRGRNSGAALASPSSFEAWPAARPRPRRVGRDRHRQPTTSRANLAQRDRLRTASSPASKCSTRTASRFPCLPPPRMRRATRPWARCA